MIKYLLLPVLLAFHILLTTTTGAAAGAASCRNPVVSGPSTWPPYVQTDKAGIRYGLAIDLVHAAFDPLFGPVRIDKAKPWARAIKDMEDGKIDIVYALLHQKEREAFMAYTIPWIDDIYAVFTVPEKMFLFTGLHSLTNRRGGYLAGIKLPGIYGRWSQENNGLREVNHLEGLYRMPHAGRLDYIVASARTFIGLNKKLFPDLPFVQLPNSSRRTPVYMAVARSSPCLQHLERINASLQKARQEFRL